MGDEEVTEFEFTYAQLVEVITQGLRSHELVKQGMYRGSLRWEEPTEGQETGLYVLRLTKMSALKEMGIDLPGQGD